MAERRMFAKTIIDSDPFLDMPLSTQCLYFHIAMRADDDGFVNNPKKIRRMIGASEDDERLLIAKKFIIPFDTGVVVIRHWKIHNYIRSDRYKPTVYQDEKMFLKIKNKIYFLCSETELDGLEGSSNLLEEDTIDMNQVKQSYGVNKNVFLTENEHEELFQMIPLQAKRYIDRLSRYKVGREDEMDDYQRIRGWMEEDDALSQERQLRVSLDMEIEELDEKIKKARKKKEEE